MKKNREIKIAIIDNAVEPEIYRPVEHWAPFLSPEWKSFRAPDRILPDLKDGFTHILLTGSEASILESESWAEEEIEFVQEAERLGLAILGSCYGHQLLARALAGPDCVGSCREPEIGWIPVVAKEDSCVFGPRGTESHVFSLHFDEVRNLPPSFVVSAGTDICPIQAFALKERPIRGYQIHPEIDPQAGRFLLQAQAARNGRGGGDLYTQALEGESCDSGLIYKIVKEFLALRLTK